MQKLWLVVGLTLCCGIAAAVDYADQQFGGWMGALDARSAALGGVSAALPNAATTLTNNPAMAAYNERAWQLSCGAALFAQREARARPTYDTFEEINYYNEYVLNEHGYGRGFAAVSYRLPQNTLPTLRLGISYQPRSSYDYDYSEEVRGTFSSGGLSDQILGYNSIRTRGGSQAFALAASAELYQGWAMGLAFNLLHARAENTASTSYIDPATADASSGWIRELDGMPLEFTLGLAYRWQQRLMLGLAFTPPLSKYDWTQEDRVNGVTTEFEETPPSILTLSVVYHPINPFRTTVVFESRTEFWSAYRRSDLPDLELSDVMALSAGVEHRVLAEVPVRLGFSYYPAPSDPNLADAIFTFGTGMTLLAQNANSQHLNLILDLAGQIGAKSYYQPDLFPETLFNGVNYSGEDRVQERVFRAFATLTLSR